MLLEGSYTVSDYDANKVGKQTITVTYKDQTAAFAVTEKEVSKPAAPEKIGGGNEASGTPD